MGMRGPYRNDYLEKLIREEAAGLMEDERRAGMLPNTVRDPEAEARKTQLYKEFLKRGGGPGYGMPNAQPIQDPFRERVPTPEEMARTTAALQVAQTPAAPTFQSFPDKFEPEKAQTVDGRIPDYDNPNAPTIERAGKELDVDRPSDFPGMADNPKMPTPDDVNSQVGDLTLRQQYLDSLKDDPNAGLSQGGPRPDPAFLNATKETSDTNRNLALISLLAKSANQMGSINGKVADSSGIEGFAKSAIGENNQSLGMMADINKMRMSAKSASSKNDKAKALLEILKLDQQKAIADQSNETRQSSNDLMAAIRQDESDWKQDIARGLQGIQRDRVDLMKNPPAKNLNPIEQEAIQAEIDLKKSQKAKNERAPAAGEGKRDPVDAKTEDALATDTAKALAAISAYDGWLAGFDAAPSDSEKINYAKMNLKELQSASYGSDAINASDEPRLSSYLNQFRPMEAFRSGGEVFGSQLSKFRDELQRKKIQAQQRVKKNQEALKGIREQGAVNYSPKIGGTTQSPPPPGKVRVRYNGKIMLIPESRLQDALKDGAEKL